MNAAQLIDVLLKIPASKRKLYTIELTNGCIIERADVLKEQRSVILEQAEGSK